MSSLQGKISRFLRQNRNKKQPISQEKLGCRRRRNAGALRWQGAAPPETSSPCLSHTEGRGHSQLREIGWGLACYTLKPLDHSQHDSHGDNADNCKYCPALPERDLVVHQRANPNQQVTDGSCTEPQALAQTLQVLGSHLRYKRQP